jgi:hypothetical protein
MELETRMTHSSRNTINADAYISEIAKLDEETTNKYKDKLRVEPKLSRTLVSFQGNKKRPFYRWYKFKEAFSADMVEYFFDTYHVHDVPVFDPFAGSGTECLSALISGRYYIGFELNPDYIEIAEKRIRDWQNKSNNI